MKFASSTAIIKDNQLNIQHNEFQNQKDKYSRNPNKNQLLKINADNQNKKQLAIFIGIFLIHILVVGLFSLILPQPFIRATNSSQLKDISIKNCESLNPTYFDTNNQLQCSDFNQSSQLGLAMLNLNKANQFGLIYMNFYVLNSSSPLVIQEQVSATLYQLQIQKQNNSQILKRLNTQQSQNNLIYWNSKNSYIDNSNKLYLSQIIGYINHLKEQNLFLLLTFASNSTYTNLNSMYMQVDLVNEQYTIYSIIIRLVYFIISLCLSFSYIKQLLSIYFTMASLQQKLIGLLSILIVTFNDPFYAITVLRPNIFSSLLSVFFIVNFLVGLIFCWILFVDRIVYEDGVFSTSQLRIFKLVYIVILYVCLMCIYLLYSTDQLQQNLIFSKNQLYQNKYNGLLIFISIWFGIGMLYILVQYIRIFINLKHKMWRNKVFSLFTLFFFVLVIVMFFLGSFQLYEYHSSRLLIIYAAINLYVFCLQFLFRFASKQKDSNQTQRLNELNQVQFQQVVSKNQQQKTINISRSSQQISNQSHQSKRKRKRKIDRKMKQQQKSQQKSQQKQDQKIAELQNDKENI